MFSFEWPIYCQSKQSTCDVFLNEYNKCLLLYFHAIDVFLPELLLGFCGLLINYSRCLTDECNKLRKQSANNTVMETTRSGCSEQFQQWGVGGKMLGKDLVRLRDLAQPASHMSERVSQNVGGAHSKKQWHVAQFLLRDGDIWCKHELFAARSSALSKTKLTTCRLRFPFGLSCASFFSLCCFSLHLEVRDSPVSDDPPRCLCHVRLGNSLGWFPWKWYELSLCLNSINLFWGERRGGKEEGLEQMMSSLSGPIL